MPDHQMAAQAAAQPARRIGPPAARRIGLFGGSFDPPHLAHLALGPCSDTIAPISNFCSVICSIIDTFRVWANPS
jgi:hypothetical protein